MYSPPRSLQNAERWAGTPHQAVASSPDFRSLFGWSVQAQIGSSPSDRAASEALQISKTPLDLPWAAGPRRREPSRRRGRCRGIRCTALYLFHETLGKKFVHCAAAKASTSTGRVRADRRGHSDGVRENGGRFSPLRNRIQGMNIGASRSSPPHEAESWRNKGVGGGGHESPTALAVMRTASYAPLHVLTAVRCGERKHDMRIQMRREPDTDPNALECNVLGRGEGGVCTSCVYEMVCCRWPPAAPPEICCCVDDWVGYFWGTFCEKCVGSDNKIAQNENEKGKGGK